MLLYQGKVVEPQGPDKDQGRNGTPRDGNVIRLPRDWVGPPDELVPMGRPPARPGDQDAAVAPENRHEKDRPLGAISDWLGTDAVLVPIPGTTGSSADAPISGDAFWGEDSAALHSAVAGPAPAPAGSAANGRVAADERTGTIAGVGRVSRRWPMPRPAAWAPLALVLVAVVLVLRGAFSASPVRHPVARLASPRVGASQGHGIRGSSKAPRRHLVARRAGPPRPRPKKNRAGSAVEARYAANSTATVSATPPPAPVMTPSANAQAAQPTYSPAATGGDSGGATASTSSSSRAGPTGKGALTGAGTTPSG